MVRAFTGEVALLWVGLMDGGYMVWPWLALAVGVALAVVPWLMSTGILETFRKPEAVASPLTDRWRGLSANELASRPRSERLLARIVLASKRPLESDPGMDMASVRARGLTKCRTGPTKWTTGVPS